MTSLNTLPITLLPSSTTAIISTLTTPIRLPTSSFTLTPSLNTLPIHRLPSTSSTPTISPYTFHGLFITPSTTPTLSPIFFPTSTHLFSTILITSPTRRTGLLTTPSPSDNTSLNLFVTNHSSPPPCVTLSSTIIPHSSSLPPT